MVWMVLLVVLMFPFAVFAQVIDPGTDFSGFMGQVFDAVKGGNWRLVAVLGAIAAIYYLRKLGQQIPGRVGAFLASSRGGAVLALAFGIAVGLGSALLAGQTLSVKVVIDVVMYAFTAVGGWTSIRRILGIDAKTLGDAAANKVVTNPSTISDVAKGLDPK